MAEASAKETAAFCAPSPESLTISTMCSLTRILRLALMALLRSHRVIRPLMAAPAGRVPAREEPLPRASQGSRTVFRGTPPTRDSNPIKIDRAGALNVAPMKGIQDDSPADVVNASPRGGQESDTMLLFARRYQGRILREWHSKSA